MVALLLARTACDLRMISLIVGEYVSTWEGWR